MYARLAHSSGPRWPICKQVFAPFDSTTIYPKPYHALLYATFDWWNEMPYKSYICLVHSISSSQILMPHKHQPLSSLLIIIMSQHLAWSSLKDMIHFISSCDLLVHPSRLNLIFTVALVHRRQVFAQASPPQAVCHFKASNLPFTLATGPSMQSLVSIFSI